MTDTTTAFADPNFVAHYLDSTPRFVPGYADVHRMAGVLIAERVSEAANVLILGAGGGLETKYLAETYASWRFLGVDPSPDMLAVATRVLGPLAERVEFHEGYIFDAPTGPFDAATCLLTLHLLSPEDRIRTLVATRARLKPGAPLIAVHSCLPEDRSARTTWLDRGSAFALAAGAQPELVKQARSAVEAQTTIFSEDEDAALFHESGFFEVEPFYSAFSLRGWVAYAL